MKAISKPTLLSVILMIAFLNFAFAQNPATGDLFRIAPSLSPAGQENQNGAPVLSLNSLSVDVKVVGNLAVTTFDMSFFNSLDRVLEGELIFPLAEGQSVSRFAMDVNGKLREGVCIEKAKGQAVFETTIRRKIDPGLLEKTAGNSFKARVYPIPAKGYKRVVIAYEQELRPGESGKLYLLPLGFRETIADFNLKVTVMGNSLSPQPAQNELQNFSFDKVNEAWIAEKTLTNYQANQQIGFILPQTENKAYSLVENGADGKTYFYAHLFPEAETISRPIAKSINLFWDASGSSANRNFELEFKFLESYFKRMGSGQVFLTLFSNKPETPRIFYIEKGEWGTLKQYLSGLSYDGGTQLGALDFGSAQAEEILLFSDGVSNFGESKPKTGGRPILVLNSSQAAEHAALQMIARSSGGIYLNLLKLKTGEALSLIEKEPLRFLRAVYDKSQIAELVPTFPEVIQGDFSISGVLLKGPIAGGNPVSITLEFGGGGKVLQTETINLSSAIQNADGLIPRIWAQKRVTELEADLKNNEAAITELGKKWGLVTRFTSLIVLDRVEDYVIHKITPPEELLEAYNRLIAEVDSVETAGNKEKLQSILENWKEITTWYDKKFPRDKPKQVEKGDSYDYGDDGDDFGDDGGDFGDGDADFNGNASDAGFSDDEDNGFGEEEPANESAVNEELENFRTLENSSQPANIPDATHKGTMTLQAWDPETPYLKRLKEVSDRQAYAVYLELRPEYKETPSFFIDCAGHFKGRGLDQEAIRILSNLTEMELENYRLLRIMAHRLSQWKAYSLAKTTFEAVLKLRPEEPQSYRDLALTEASLGHEQRAIDLLSEVILGAWSDRFPNVEMIALVELNHIIAMSKGKKPVPKLLDPKLFKLMPVDVRVVLNWDADNADIDLWVTDPYGEKCYYGHRETHTGGRISNDFTGGYGPEEFMIRSAIPGTYKVQANFYGDNRESLAGPPTLVLQFFIRYETGREEKKEVVLRVDAVREVIDIGEFEFK